MATSTLSVKRTLFVSGFAVVVTDADDAEAIAGKTAIEVSPADVVAAAGFDFLMNLGEFFGGRPRRRFPTTLVGVSSCKEMKIINVAA